MKTILFFVLIFSFASPVYSQSELVNQYDSSGKKDGKWIVYLDEYLNTISDTLNYTYIRYTFFVDGVDIYPKLHNYSGKNYQLKKEEFKSKPSNKKLTGTFTFYDSSGKSSSQHVFKNGNYISIKEFDKKERLRHYFDFTVKSNEDPLSYCWYQYNKKGIVKITYFFQRDENGNWPKSR